MITVWKNPAPVVGNVRRFVRKTDAGNYYWFIGIVGGYYEDAERGFCNRDDLPADIAARCDRNYEENPNIETHWPLEMLA